MTHPGHYWICLWLAVLSLHSCDQSTYLREQTEIMRSIERKMPNNGSKDHQR